MAVNKIIIALSGRKQAGKNEIACFIHKHFRERYAFGSISTLTTVEFSFADNLKEFCIDTLGINREQCYGTEEQKNSPTEYTWDNVSEFYRWKFGPSGEQLSQEEFWRKRDASMRSGGAIVDLWKRNYKTGPMSGRDVMQLFGTDLIRETFGNVWAKATIRKIKKSDVQVALITDNRFPNEVKAVLDEPNGHVIRLTRSPLGTTDQHPSEAALDGYDWYRKNCYVLDNAEMTIEEQNMSVMHIIDRKIMSGEINE